MKTKTKIAKADTAMEPTEENKTDQLRNRYSSIKSKLARYRTTLDVLHAEGIHTAYDRIHDRMVALEAFHSIYGQQIEVQQLGEELKSNKVGPSEAWELRSEIHHLMSQLESLWQYLAQVASGPTKPVTSFDDEG